MKKLVLTIGCALAVTGAAFAQGNVNWSAISSTSVTAQTNNTLYSPLFGGGTGPGSAIGGTLGAGNYYLELLYTAYSGVQAVQPTTLSGLEAWSDAGASGQSTASAGKLAPLNGSSGFTVPWSPGTTDSIMLVIWSADLGTTWSGVQNILNNWSANMSNPLYANSFLGVSTTGYITTFATTTTPGSQVFGAATAQGVPIISLGTQMYALPIPEPATMALAGLGGLALLLIRRRK